MERQRYPNEHRFVVKIIISDGKVPVHFFVTKYVFFLVFINSLKLHSFDATLTERVLVSLTEYKF